MERDEKEIQIPAIMVQHAGHHVRLPVSIPLFQWKEDKVVLRGKAHHPTVKKSFLLGPAEADAASTATSSRTGSAIKPLLSKSQRKFQCHWRKGDL